MIHILADTMMLATGFEAPRGHRSLPRRNHGDSRENRNALRALKARLGALSNLKF